MTRLFESVRKMLEEVTRQSLISDAFEGLPSCSLDDIRKLLLAVDVMADVLQEFTPIIQRMENERRMENGTANIFMFLTRSKEALAKIRELGK